MRRRFISDNFLKTTCYAYASVCGIGFMPIIPGTFGSIVGLFIYVTLRGCAHCNLYLSIIIVVASLLALPAINYILKNSAFTQKRNGDNKNGDPSFIVIDEVVGQLITILLVSQFCYIGWYHLFLCFFCFRVLTYSNPGLFAK